MNYFFWLLAFKDGSFSDGLKQALWGAGLLSPTTSSESRKWMPWEGDFISHYDHSPLTLLLFPFGGKIGGFNDGSNPGSVSAPQVPLGKLTGLDAPGQRWCPMHHSTPTICLRMGQKMSEEGRQHVRT